MKVPFFFGYIYYNYVEKRANNTKNNDKKPEVLLRYT